MRIGFDAKRLFFNQTGLGVYSRLLVTQLATRYPENEYILYATRAEKSKYYSDYHNLSVRGKNGFLWRSIGLAGDVQQDQCDLFHGLSHEIPVGLSGRKVKTVVTIHDVIFRRYPQLFPFIDRQIYDLKWAYSCKNADHIIAVSEHTRKDIIEFYEVVPDKIEVIHPPVNTMNKPHHEDEKKAIQAYGLEQPYWLYVGALNPRKNLELIIRVLPKLKERYPLIVIGTGSSYEQEMKTLVSELDLNHQVRFVGHVANHDLATFYKHALALIYPSLYEGFGIPIVESLQNKTPVITSQTSSMPEAAGPGAILIDPGSEESLQHAMEKMSADKTLRQKMADEGNVYVKQFQPEIIAEETMALYKKAIENSA